MIKIIALVKNVTNSVDGGFILKLDLAESFGKQAGLLLQSVGKNMAVALEETNG